MPPNCDIGLIADFGAPSSSREAATTAEAIAEQFHLKADVRTIESCSNALLADIHAEIIELK